MSHVALVPDVASRWNGSEGSGFPRSPVSSLIASVFGRAEAPVRATVVFAATERQAGVSWMASTVTAELARNGRSVLLADALAVMAAQNQEEALNRCMQAGHGGAWVLSSQKRQRTEAALITGTHRTGAILTALLQQFPHVVIDTPALSVSDVAMRFAPLVSGAVFVVCADKTERRVLVKACGRFGALGGRVLGCAFNAGLRQE